eukprot:CAMPEP_0174922576 /NCGR_PEP_ID=MMETSP1355-20121228/5970_1 /TAXON_ID=464990 /ORGANISM="Hemiselmis tepida, Strain CCMP443" /LENGTH=478 /DNA_ID=CAMNT_0016168177 /DNA_START=72 /DNA_END=1505 /DNA_ORIENTATION=+
MPSHTPPVEEGVEKAAPPQQAGGEPPGDEEDSGLGGPHFSATYQAFQKAVESPHSPQSRQLRQEAQAERRSLVASLSRGGLSADGGSSELLGNNGLHRKGAGSGMGGTSTEDGEQKLRSFSLRFNNDTVEEGFRESVVEAHFPIGSIVLIQAIALTVILFHRLVNLEPSAGKLAGSVLLSLPGAVTILAHLLGGERVRQAIVRHYGAVVVLNVIPLHFGFAIINIFDELEVTDEWRCPRNPSACPTLTADQEAHSFVLFSAFVLNLACPLLFRQRVQLALAINVAHMASTLLFPVTSEIAAALLFVLAAQAGTLAMSYTFELQLRKLYWQDLEMHKHKLRIASILTTVLPPRLIREDLAVPLVESFDGVPVLFCSFDKEAVLRFCGPQDFFDALDRILTLFDEVVGSTGLWKVEHVGEDYVVCGPQVRTNSPEDSTLEARRRHGIAIVRLAMAMVKEGNQVAVSQVEDLSMSRRAGPR